MHPSTDKKKLKKVQITLSPELHIQAKVCAFSQGETLNNWIRTAIEKAVGIIRIKD